MKTTIAKRFDFDAAHHLPLVPDGHKCKRVHGHTYVVEVATEGEPGPDGMVIDYSEIARAWVPLDATLDHRDLNEIPGLDNPTTEVLAAFILARLPAWICRVRVFESATTWCEVSR